MIKSVFSVLLISSAVLASFTSCEDNEDKKENQVVDPTKEYPITDPTDPEKSITMHFLDSANVDITESGKIGDYTYVDLGLPSGTKWATYNVGASTSTGYGDYFAWGETETKGQFTDNTYKYEADSYKGLLSGFGSWRGYNKYTIADGTYASQDSVAWYDKEGHFIGDSLTTLEPSDDAATANWGEDWRMPTKTDICELIKGCNWTWTDNVNGSGVAGCIGTSKANGNTIFLPATGYYYNASLNCAGAVGCYMSSSLSEDNSDSEVSIGLSYDYFDWLTYYRCNGLVVRAVSVKK